MSMGDETVYKKVDKGGLSQQILGDVDAIVERIHAIEDEMKRSEERIMKYIM